MLSNKSDFFQVPESLVESEEFFEMENIFKKIFLFSLWVKVILAKYISLWLLAEGTVILSGKNNKKNLTLSSEQF